ncbi:hypothetical protein IQ250_29840 [Pseudanabaenaceae cyanobacterium LEGE 13415]|nr:hypothetical protein [Pseudanabaenaceae cyanobacterium LEGE 13415]
MPFNHSHTRKNLLVSRSCSSSKPFSISSRSIIVLPTVLLIVTSSMMAKVPGCAIALNLIAAYVLLALLAMRLLPELFQLAQRWKWVGAIAGIGLFALIVTPAQAAIFDTAEKYTTQIFGTYIDSSMITLIFGFLRISAFIMGAAFVLLALEKARHGENWQPFAWNAFAVLMVVVLVEGMSSLFLSSTTTATPKPSPSP